MNPFPSASTANPRLNRRRFIQYGAICISSSLVAACVNSNQASTSNFGLDKVTLGSNWLAQAEHGGFYQALKLVGLENFESSYPRE